MPTAAIAEPVAPGQARTPSQSVAFGRHQWTRKFRVFSSQWSQPGLMKLAAATLGEAAIHSSQIFGFATGKLRDPAPKVILALGQLNLAIAAANGKADLPPHHPQCPGTASELWQDKRYMTDADGKPLDAVGCYLAITGQIDLGCDVRSGVLSKETMPAISKAVGKYLRFKLMEQGIDFMEMENANTPEGLLLDRVVYGKALTVSELTNADELIAKAAQVPVDQLWDEAIMPAVATQ